MYLMISGIHVFPDKPKISHNFGWGDIATRLVPWGHEEKTQTGMQQNNATTSRIFWGDPTGHVVQRHP